MQNLKKQLHVYNILALIDGGMLTRTQAIEQLHVSRRHLRRLLKRFRAYGRKFPGVLEKLKSAWNGTPPSIITDIVKLKMERPTRSNQYIAELIEARHGRKISRSSIRNILIRHDSYQVQKTERRGRDILLNRKSGHYCLITTGACIFMSFKIQKCTGLKPKSALWA